MALTKAKITNKENGDVITFRFNPTEYSISKTNPWQSKPVVGRNVPKLDFTGGGAQTLSLEIFLDVYEKEGADVSAETRKLFQLTLVQEKLWNEKTNKSRPPLCIFEWGPNWSFTAVVMKLDVRYTLFRPDGTPVRATAKITLQEAEDFQEQPAQNPTSHSDQPGRRRREVRPHDTLALISFEEYGDANRWRDIARENNIDDPLSIRPGQILAIPSRY
jgi:nucleoid-associated protein YgaU